jgi:hypothetical protein
VINGLVLAVLVLAVARLTRLLTTDQVTLPVRTWVIRKHGEESAAAYFVFCPWCVSIWVSAPMTAITFAVPHWWNWTEWIWYGVLTFLAVSHATGLIASKLEND